MHIMYDCIHDNDTEDDAGSRWFPDACGIRETFRMLVAVAAAPVQLAPWCQACPERLCGRGYRYRHE
jgi:hypothetical protein